VCVFALGDSAVADVDVDVDVATLARYLEDAYKLPITGLPSASLDGVERSSEEFVDHDRRQLKANAVLESLKVTYPAIWADSQVTLIAVTPHDSFDSRSPDFDYLYSVRALRPGRCRSR
jgi:hypothetical protein